MLTFKMQLDASGHLLQTYLLCALFIFMDHVEFITISKNHYCSKSTSKNKWTLACMHLKNSFKIYLTRHLMCEKMPL